MADDISPERIKEIAGAARVPLRPEAPARIARAIAPTAQRFAAENLALPMEIEPAIFTVVQRKEMRE